MKDMITLWCWVAWASTLYAQSADPAEFFEMRVRPVLARNCFACHTQSKMGGLEMISRESLLKGGSSGPAIVSGDAESSLLIQAVRKTHAKIKMPPQSNLTDAEIADLAAWIKAGAVWPAKAVSNAGGDKKAYVISAEQRAFWSFVPVAKVTPPAVRDAALAKSAIDSFLGARMEEKGVQPNKPAARRALIRRAYFDLTGLPPTPEAVEAFVADSSEAAFAKVVDGLLQSPHYGERWGRHWLDLARYSDDKLTPGGNDRLSPYPNAFRYRDWVVKAFNDDMPYDRFVKAQIAGDLMAESKDLIAGLGLYGLSPEFQEDRVDVTSRTFLGLTVACAQCHDHKFDPIPQKDFLSWSGIFNRTRKSEYPLAEKEIVDRFQAQKKKVDEQQQKIKDFLEAESQQLGELLARKAVRYMMAARDVNRAVQTADAVAAAKGLDRETLERWAKYLKSGERDHTFLKQWEELDKRNASDEELLQAAEKFQSVILEAIAEKKTVDEQNLVRLGGSKERGSLVNTQLATMNHDKFLLWGDFFKTGYDRLDPSWRPDGFLYYGDGSIDRWLSGEWKSHLDELRAEQKKLRAAMPPEYPYLHVIENTSGRGRFRGGANGAAAEEVPPRFLSILCEDQPQPFETAKARLQLAEAIASPQNPLTARVMANRIWMHHFGTGLVRTTSNFGQLGERPVNPELLDYLAARLIANGWSMKAMHREIMLSSAYAASSEIVPKNQDLDAENRLQWRANRRRLEAEELRDAMLAASGELDVKAGGAPAKLGQEHLRRTLYSFVSRQKPDSAMTVFDFPNPNQSAEQRVATSTPLQGLYLLNSGFVAARAAAFAKRLEAKPDDAARIREAYRILYYREPQREEVELGLAYVAKASWQRYAQVLLTSNEFTHVN